jgi:glycosyltransferase 2 family protein
VTIIVTTIPVAIAGWGLRETFIVTLLMAAGLRLESALLLSVSFGTILLLAALPGALIWLGSGRPAVQSQLGRRFGPSQDLKRIGVIT